MRCAKRGVWVVVIGLAAVATVWADVATPRPQWTAVRMASEEVQIALGEQRVQVDAVFELQNTGAASTVRIGYPLGLFEKELKGFAVAVDGKAFGDVKTQAGSSSTPGLRGGMGVRGRPVKGVAAEPYRFQGPYKEWKVFDVPFGANETKSIRVTYSVEPAQVADKKAGALRLYSYTLKTGATWKGKIDKATIRVKLDGVPASRLVRVVPAGAKRSGQLLAWTLKDFEPTDNIEITWRPAAVAAR